MIRSRTPYVFRNLEPDPFGWYVGGCYQASDGLHKGILEYCLDQEDAIYIANKLLQSLGARDIKLGRL